MSIPITIEKLPNKSIVEPARIELRENRNPDATLKQSVLLLMISIIMVADIL